MLSVKSNLALRETKDGVTFNCMVDLLSIDMGISDFSQFSKNVNLDVTFHELWFFFASESEVYL